MLRLRLYIWITLENTLLVCNHALSACAIHVRFQRITPLERQLGVDHEKDSIPF